MSEYLLIKSDLEGCITLLNIYANFSASAGQNKASAADNLVMAAVFRDIIVQFVACFEKRRHALTIAAVYADCTGADEYFKWLRELRNSYAAHAYGAARQCKIGVAVDSEGNYLGVGHLMAVYQGMGPSDLTHLMDFIKIAASYNSNRCDDLARAVDMHVREITCPDLLAAPDVELEAPGAVQLVQSRGYLEKGHLSKKK